MVSISSFMYLKISRKGIKRLGGRSDQHPCLAKLPLEEPKHAQEVRQVLLLVEDALRECNDERREAWRAVVSELRRRLEGAREGLAVN